MRRALVIFLVLLFPLNVFALSMSVAHLHLDHGTERVEASVAASSADSGPAADFDCETSCDIDPDEPPSGAELHYIVGQDGGPLPGGRPARALSLPAADPPCHSIPPPVKPPRAA